MMRFRLIATGVAALTLLASSLATEAADMMGGVKRDRGKALFQTRNIFVRIVKQDQNRSGHQKSYVTAAQAIG